MVPPAGLKPAQAGLEDRCSIIDAMGAFSQRTWKR